MQQKVIFQSSGEFEVDGDKVPYTTTISEEVVNGEVVHLIEESWVARGPMPYVLVKLRLDE